MDRHPDVLVIGGGVVGLAAAMWCRRLGVERVLVVERARLAGGATGGAGGALAPELHHQRGPQAFVTLARASLALYRELDQEWEGALGLTWKPLLLLTGPADQPARPWGPQVELLDADQVAALVPDLAPGWTGVLARDQAHVHPLRLVTALARRAGAVLTGVEAGQLERDGRAITRVPSTIGDLHPGKVIVATGLAPRSWLRLSQRPVKGHLVATAPTGVRLPCGVHGNGIGIGSLPDGGLLAGGTVDDRDHTAAVRPEVVADIRRRVQALLPAVGQLRLTHRWCCFRPAIADGLPVIDRLPETTNAWVSVGHGGTGILLALAAGRALATWLISGRRPAELEPYRLDRLPYGTANAASTRR